MGSLSKDNPQGLMVVVICTVFTILAAASTILRLWSRRIKRARLRTNDYAILAALFFALITYSVIVTAVVAGGLGQHITTLVATPERIIIFIKCYLAMSCTWIMSVTLVKVSILDLYISIFRIRWFINICYEFLLLQLIFGTTSILDVLLICRPLNPTWDPTVESTCGNKSKAYLATHTTTLMLDLSICILPMPVLWGLKMQISKKVGTSCLFGIGAVICVITSLRIGFLDRINDPDATYNWAVLFLFSALEALLGITLACLPILPPEWLLNQLETVQDSKLSRGLANPRSIPPSKDKISFRRLAEDSYPIAIDTETHALHNVDAENIYPVCSQANNIHVTKAWDVHSDQDK